MERAVVSIVLSTLRDLLLEEARFLYGVSDEVKTLQAQLEEMQCLLEDADRRQDENKSIANWIAQIRDLAHRAEDAIERYAVHVSSKRGRGLKRLLGKFSCVLTCGCTLHRIGSKISRIRSDLARVTASMQGYGIKSIIQGESSTAAASDNKKWKVQTFPDETEDCFVGKENELEQLVSLIFGDNQHTVVSIWGMGGIGKTTIARKVYNHDRKRSFESFAWVCITQQCQIRSVLEDVLKQLMPRKKDDTLYMSNTELIQQKRDDISSLTDTELIGKLCQIQRVRRCMIVLDDIWEIDHWDGFKHAFLVQGSKSKIMVTTRNQKVAGKVGLPVELGLLSLCDGLDLLKKKAFPDNNIPGDFASEENFLKIAEEMVHKCGYLPLVISLLGGVLSKKKSMSDWELVNKNISAYLEEEEEINGVLSLSYEDLPYYLKPCFLYMGVCREGEIMNASVLYRLWIAHGMISQENQREDRTLVATAELYLSELVSRCLVQVQVEDAISGRKFRTWKLHDVVRELCLSMGRKEFGLHNLNYQGRQVVTLGNKARHLAIYFEREMEPERIFHKDVGKHVRSLILFNLVHRERAEFPHKRVEFQKFKLLRVLILGGFNFTKGKLPKGIGYLIHLRYLSFRFCKLDELPSSISNLAYLHTLDLHHTENVRLPNVLKKMRRLRYLLLPAYTGKNLEIYQLRLDEGLDELEVLLGFNSLVHELKSIIRMKNLRFFSARVSDNENLSAIVDAIKTNWKNLISCTVMIKHGCQLTSVELEKVFTSPHLHHLGIHIQLGKLLEGCGNEITTSRLVSLRLFACEIKDDPMKMLGKLPFLEELHLLEGSFVGEEMDCDALSFPRLKKLVLFNLPNLLVWRVEKGAMSIISEIEIYDCPSLMMVPDGLRFAVTLKQLSIVRMPRLGKRASHEGGEDFDKVKHVPSIIIYDDEQA